jgi:hypothetical protein
MKAIILIENGSLPQWSLLAIKRSINYYESITVLNCTNRIKFKFKFKFLNYYILNIFSIRNKMNKLVPFDLGVNLKGKVQYENFESEIKNNWQSFPPKTIKFINSKNFDVVIKFGLGLLRVPESLILKYGIISYHHGDPSMYRGRPAGFYEILNKSNKLGIIIQKINNKLDAGDVIASISSPVFLFSYKKTLQVAYHNSIDLLQKALYNLENNSYPNLNKNGKVYKLPNNYSVLKFTFNILINGFSRIIEIFFKEKKWRIASIEGNYKNLDNNNIHLKEKLFSINKKYSFYADPFIIDGNKIILEGLNKITKKGEIIIYDEKNPVKILNFKRKHLSYPSILKLNNIKYLLPEMSSHKKQEIFELEDERVINSYSLNGFDGVELIDPTYYKHKNIHYIFGGIGNTANYKLSLWYLNGDIFNDKFNLHPLSPIVTSPRGARMGGNIFVEKDRIIRFGQNYTTKYGNGIIIHEIEELSPTDYKEKEIDFIKFKNRYGPHTINFDSNLTIYDFYDEKINLFSFFSKILNRI